MINDELTTQQVDAVLQALNDAIEQGPWNESNFLRVIGRNLHEIRDGFIKKIEMQGQVHQGVSPYLIKQMALRHGQQKIYVALYSSDGTNIGSWERIIANLPHQMISRPIYAHEADVKAMIKSKENKINEAYVTIYISPQDILPLPADKMPVDKLGKQMLTIKDRTLHLDSLDCFVHQSGVYRYLQGRLVKDNAA
ncbi:MAG TPA: Dot/Icm secretion system protein IcmQ [Legionella sp.]|nr:Dot/Icm secretion system protein IcmQ [Legionella sp.]